jgi:hypothetical protein
MRAIVPRPLLFAVLRTCVFNSICHWLKFQRDRASHHPVKSGFLLIVTSHSPTLAAGTALRSIVQLRGRNGATEAFSLAALPVSADGQRPILTQSDCLAGAAVLIAPVSKQISC